MKKIILITALLLLFPLNTYAKESAELVKSKVLINKEEYKSEYSKYPFIKYKNTIYFPATFYNLRAVGLEGQVKDKLFTIQEDNIISSLYDYKSENKNENTILVHKSPFKEDIFGNKNSKSKETLFFRDILYFPLDKDSKIFENIDYKYNELGDFEIESKGPRAKNISQIVTFKNKDKENKIYPISNGEKIYLYENDKIYSIDVKDKSKKEIYDFLKNSDNKDYTLESLKIEDGILSAYFYTNKDLKVIKFKDNKASEILSYNLKEINGNKYFVEDSKVYGNLFIIKNGSKEKIGSDNYLYDKQIGEYKNNLYLRAKNKKGKNILLSINPNTKESKEIVDISVDGFKMDKYLIYFWNKDGIYFYNIDFLDKSDTLKLSPGTYKKYAAIKGIEDLYPNRTMTPFFVKDNLLCETAGSEDYIKLNGDGKLKSIKRVGKWTLAIFDNSKTGIKFLISDGLTSYKGVDKLCDVSIVKDKAYYYNIDTGKIVEFELLSN